MITFRQKDFSNYIVSDALKGAKIGAAVGTTIGGVGIKKLPKFIPGADKYNLLVPTLRELFPEKLISLILKGV